MDADRLLAEVWGLALRAGVVIAAARAGGLQVGVNPDGSPSSNADKAAEALITATLQALLPDVPVVAEESVHAGAGRPAGVDAGFWCVDPLDGTRGFIEGGAEVCVNIALVRQGQPVLGVIHAPFLGETFGAVLPGPALAARRPGGPVDSVRARAMPADGATVLHSARHDAPEALAALLGPLPVARRVPMSSAIKFCRLACGEGDVYPRIGRTGEWDTAAGQALLEAAGGRVCRLDGSPLRYGKPGFLNDGFIAYGLR